MLVPLISDNGISPKEVSGQEFSSSSSEPVSGMRSRVRRVWKGLVVGVGWGGEPGQYSQGSGLRWGVTASGWLRGLQSDENVLESNHGDVHNCVSTLQTPALYTLKWLK